MGTKYNYVPTGRTQLQNRRVRDPEAAACRWRHTRKNRIIGTLNT